MFTGIITDLGQVAAVEGSGGARIRLETAYDTDAIAIGDSIACGGACLTVVAKGPGWFAVDASRETLACTTLGGWRRGTRVNLERPLTLARELGGHLVTGHVDGTAAVVSRAPDGESVRIVFEVGPPHARLIAQKGSVALDGVSLTVNEVEDLAGGRARFGVNIIPHTQAATTFGAIAPGDRVNLEVDVLARYAARLLGRT
ncbi:MAG: riboflavin synthase [Alphaproteobacteria bacterium]